MKEFSDYEKKILKELIRVDETPGALTVLGNIIDSELTPNFYIELKSENNCPVRIAKSFIDKITTEYGNIGLNEAMKQLNNKLLLIVKLFEFLEKEKFIHLTGELPISILGTTFDTNETPVGYELIDKETGKKLYKLSRKTIVPDDLLKKLVKNNFKNIMNDSDQVEKRVLGLQRNSFYVTVIGVLLTAVGLWFAFKSAYPDKQKPENPSKSETIQPVKPDKGSSVGLPIEPATQPEQPTEQKTSKNNKINEKLDMKNQKDIEKEEIQKGVMDEFKK